MTTNIYIENTEPSVIQGRGLKTKLPVTLSGTGATLTVAGATTLPASTTIGGSSVSALGVITSTSANALTVGPAGATNPSFNVDASTASAATGINIKSAAAASGVAISVVSSGTDETVTLDAKGAGKIVIGATSTGHVSLGRGSLKPALLSGTITSLGTAQSTTPTAAQLRGGFITQTSATGAGTCTLDTGTNLSTSVAGITVGDSFQCIYANLGGGQTVTITGATGSTVIGSAAVASGKNATMTFVNTGTNTWNVYVNVSA